jgi:hypothetical protein
LWHPRITLNCVEQAAFLSIQDHANVAALLDGTEQGCPASPCCRAPAAGCEFPARNEIPATGYL